jgi:hypothetical protein
MGNGGWGLGVMGAGDWGTRKIYLMPNAHPLLLSETDVVVLKEK